MMITHHQEAIAMAQTELKDGRNPEARPLAQRIIDDQQPRDHRNAASVI